MGGGRAFQFGFDVTADVAGGQSVQAQAGEHEVGKVLTNAAFFFQHLAQGRGDGGRAGLVSKVGVDALHEVLHSGEQRPFPGKRLSSIRPYLRKQRHQRRIQNKLAQRQQRRFLCQSCLGSFPGNF